MGNDASFTRIYDLKTAGVDKVLADVNAVIARLEILGQVKNKVSATDIGDPSVVADLNKQYNNLVGTVDRMAKSQEGLSDALAQVIELQRGVTMSMQESSQAMGSNISASTAALTKYQGSMAATRAASEQYSLTSADLGERLKIVKDEIEATTQQLKILGDQYRNNVISDEEYTVEGGRLTTQLVEQRVESQALTQMLKMQAVAQDAVANSINDARAQGALYRKELNSLNLSTEQGVARQKELIVVIAELDAFIKSNADLYTRQKINIGNYPTLTAEFGALRAEMQRLAVAGEQDSAEFAKLQARALELSAAMKEVNASTAQVATTSERFGSIVERMGLRMVANLLIFQAAMELGSYLYDQWTKDAKAAKELNDKLKDIENTAQSSAIGEFANVQLLSGIAGNTAEAMDIRLRAVKELQDTYPDYLGNLSKEAILTGDIADALHRLNEDMLAKAAMDASINKIKELGKQYADLNAQIRELNLKQTRDIANSTTPQGREAIISYYENLKNGILAKIQAIKIASEQYLKDAQNFALMAGELAVDRKKDKKTKSPSDYLNADKDLADALAALSRVQIQEEANKNKLISDNIQESLDERLQANERYFNDLNALASVEYQKAIADEVSKQKELERKLKDGKVAPANYATEINASNTRKDASGQTYSNTLAQNAEAKSAQDKKIYNDQVTLLNEMIAKGQELYQTAADKELLILSEKFAKGKIREKKYQEEKKKILDKSNLDYLNAVIDQIALEIKVSKLGNDAKKKLIDELATYKKKKLEAEIKQNEDTGKKEKIDKTQMYQSLIDVATHFANESLALLEKQDAYKQATQQRQMNWNEKMLNSEAQSNQERLRNDKAFYMAQQSAEKEKMRIEKKRAEAQAAIDYGSAAISLLPRAIKDGGWPTVAIEEGALLAIFLDKMAMLQRAPTYAQGIGNHPGGLAWIGDGGEHELVRIGNKYSVSPNTPTLANLPSGAQVTPFSQLGGNLKAPSFHVNSTAGAGSSDLHGAIAAQGHQISAMAASISSMKIIYEPHKAIRSNNRSFYKRIKV